MNIFNSLGSNYDWRFVLKALFAKNKESYSANLKNLLEKKYNGEVLLAYKGRQAIELTLEILNLPKESFIAINGFTCVAVFNSIRKAGFEPVCLDLQDSGGLNFTPDSLEKTLSKNKKISAVIIQNTLGYPCDIEGILAICKRHNLILIEDLAHCVGTRYPNGKETGTMGDFVVLSFSQDKIIDSVSGGALVIRNKKYFDKGNSLGGLSKPPPMWIFRDRIYQFETYKIRAAYKLGLGKPYHFLLKKLGLLPNVMNQSFYDYYSLPNWHASLALYQFKHLDTQLNHRRKIAQIYVSLLPENILMFAKEKNKEAVSLSSNLRFPIFVENRSKLIRKLKDQGVYISDVWYTDVAPQCPNAVDDSKMILNLPTHINITEKDAKNISLIIIQWLKSQ